MDTIEESTRLDQMVKKYIQLRDRKAQLKKTYDEQTEAIDLVLAACEKHFLIAMNEQGLEALPTAEGVPYKTKKTSATVADPSMFRQWVVDSGEWAALDIKANKTYVAAYKEEHKDLPPGVNWFEAIAVNVKRK